MKQRNSVSTLLTDPSVRRLAPWKLKYKTSCLAVALRGVTPLSSSAGEINARDDRD